MMEGRNPYEPTTVPLFTDPPAPSPKKEYELAYGGFWIRVGAYLLDFLLLSPLIAIQYFGAQWSSRYFVYSPVPVLLFAVFYWIYLVKRFGGTPGKRALRLRIAMVDGTRVTGFAAIVRYLPFLMLTALSSLSTLIAAQRLNEADYLSLKYLYKMAYLVSLRPPWGAWLSNLMAAWMLLVVICMLCNYRRRAVHDYFAGTVVLRERG